MLVPDTTFILSAASSAPTSTEASSLHFPESAQLDNRVSIPLLYADGARNRFCEELPIELVNTIPAEVFSTRIESINSKIRRLWTIRDYSPVIRLLILFAFVIYCVVVLNFTSSFTGFPLSGILLVIGVVAACIRVIEAELRNFNELDKGIGLQWESIRTCAANAFDMSSICAKWTILVKKHIFADNAGANILPPYCSSESQPEFLVAERDVGEERSDLPDYQEGFERPVGYMAMLLTV
ncbi:hypothetical protein HDU83_006003 [Entophlyctis luteolus]|nr:hypothetical protein HDU83_006003 [Entophlyctis luteolus]